MAAGHIVEDVVVTRLARGWYRVDTPHGPAWIEANEQPGRRTWWATDHAGTRTLVGSVRRALDLINDAVRIAGRLARLNDRPVTETIDGAVETAQRAIALDPQYR